jgi:hypothetical protein
MNFTMKSSKMKANQSPGQRVKFGTLLARMGLQKILLGKLSASHEDARAAAAAAAAVAALDAISTATSMSVSPDVI